MNILLCDLDALNENDVHVLRIETRSNSSFTTNVLRVVADVRRRIVVINYRAIRWTVV